MALLIDGYNLLHVTSIVGSAPRARFRGARQGSPHRGPSELQRSREALLRFLAASIDEAERPRTTIVFDAKDAPPGLPRTVDHNGMTIRYASEYADADTLIEELIQSEAAPRSLLVVSSDHRIQRAARRRRAPAIDSDRWYADLCRRRHARQHARRPRIAKPVGPLSDAEVAYWLRQFVLETEPASETEPTSNMESTADTDLPGDVVSGAVEIAGDDDFDNPFPPGYGEDLLDDEEREPLDPPSDVTRE